MEIIDLSSMVTTTLGDVPEGDLDIVLAREDARDTWIMKRVFTYKGTAFPNAVGTVVRQDAWITFKNGQGADAAAGL